LANFFNRVFSEDKAGGRIRARTEPRSIVLIALKHGLDPLSLTNAMVDAYKGGTQHLGALEITYRRDNKASHMFLFTEEGKVVSQFPLTLDLVSDPNLLRRLVEDFPVPYRFTEKPCSHRRNIEELKFGMKKVDVGARIVEIPPRKLITTEYGNQCYVSNAKIADDTGTIRLSLWNDQIDNFHVGDRVEVENCYVSSFGGEQQLRIGRKGAISVK
jgi:replication factor A1